MSRPKLSSAEDAELRRLHVLASFGTVANKVSSRYTELRARDRRKDIREPVEVSALKGASKR